MLEISSARRVKEAVRAACRRRRIVLAVEHLAVAVGLMLAGAVALLLAGTQLLAWWWPVVLGIAGAAVGLWRVRGSRVSEYRVAQMVDRRCRLNDSLSTAWFLLSQKERETDPVARFQIEHAARLAAGVNTSRAFPLHGGRNWAVTGALAGVVFGLFAVRYLVTSSLDLRPALIRIPFTAVVEQSEQKRPAQDKQIASLGAVDRQLADPQAAGAQDAQQSDGAAAEETGKTNKGVAEASGRGPKQEKSVGEGEAPGDSEQADGKPGRDGLLDKMKDALSSLMAKMRPNSGSPQKAAQNGQQAPREENGAKQNNAAAKHGDQSDSRDSQAKQQQSANAQAQGQTKERMQAAQGQDPGKSPEKGNDSHSGIGRQNGDKELKDAEALRAMGRLEEIIGKRSASVTGDMMVETPSGKQQLKTAYSQRVGQHADLGGEINRDEIPLADRAYVREYMELVHKQAKAR